MTDASSCAAALVRSPGHFDWLAIDALAMVIYVYASALRRGAIKEVLLSVSFFGIELMWEMFNALVLHFSNYAPLWAVSCTSRSSYLLYVGLNLEIALMFAVAPLSVLAAAQTPGFSPRLRQAVPLMFGVFCVMVETLLNHAGVLVWQWSFWRFPQLGLILAVYAGPFWLLLRAYDRFSVKALARATPVIAVVALLCHLLLGTLLGWV